MRTVIFSKVVLFFLFTEKIVRKELIDQIPNLAVLARECSTRIPALKTVVSEYFLPMVVRNLGTDENFVRKAAETSLFTLMEHGLVTKMEAEIQVCPTILALSREESATDNHVGAVTVSTQIFIFAQIHYLCFPYA